MKFMINGALTIGTLDRANVEIREEAGPENFFLRHVRRRGRGALGAGLPAGIPHRGGSQAGRSAGVDRGRNVHPRRHRVLRPVLDNLVHHDPFLVLADYRSYVDCQTRVSAAWRDPDTWSHMSILNTARSGRVLLGSSYRPVLRRDLARAANADAAG